MTVREAVLWTLMGAVAIPTPLPPSPLPTRDPSGQIWNIDHVSIVGSRPMRIYYASEVAKGLTSPKCGREWVCYSLGADGKLRPFEVTPRRAR